MEEESKPLHTLTHEGETKACPITNHWTKGSPYPREAVPIENFYIKGDRNNIASVCIHCREYAKKLYEEKSKKNKEKREEENKTDSPFKTCFCDYHPREGVSKYPRDKVPKELFIVEKRKGEFEESLRCADCRNAIQRCRNENHQKQKEEASKQGKFHCQRCWKNKNSNQMALCENGERSEKICRICQIKVCRLNTSHYKRMKSVYMDIKREKVEEIGCSCNRCKCILLKPEEGSYSHIKLETFMEDNIRYVKYKDELIPTHDFIKKYPDLLEYRTSDLDHVNEAEQREMGMIGPNDPFMKKKGNINSMGSEKDMREEAKITQILCVECHIRVGVERAGPGSKKLDEEKLRMITEFRRRGCECCGWYDENLLRFLECDHIDPVTKIDTISNMLQRSNYTREQLAAEIIKCRILCRACHRIRTWEQFREKVRLRELKYETEELPLLIEHENMKVSPIYGDERDYEEDRDLEEDRGLEENSEDLEGLECFEGFKEEDEEYDF